MKNKREDLIKIPKVELHRHLELSVRHSTLKELAPLCGIQLSGEADFREKFVISEPMSNLGAVLNKFLDTQKLWQSPELLERMTFECCEDAYLNEGIVILELRYSPTFVRMGHEHMSFETIHEAIFKGAKRAMDTYPMVVGFVGIIQRILPVSEAEAVTQFVIDNKDTFIGLDLADNEEGFDSKPFAPFFSKAKKAGLGITVHSGEANLPNAPRYVMEAIEHLGAQRIGHGVQVYRDKNVMNFLIDKRIPLELCLTSNWLTQAVSEIEKHPIRSLMDQGLLITINTDDPGIFDIDMIQEYEKLEKYFGFTSEDFNRCNEVAAQFSFISEDLKRKVWPSLK